MTTTYKKNSYIKNKKLRNASTQLHGESNESNTNETNLLQQNLFYTNKDTKNRTFISISTSSAIDPFLIDHRITETIRGSNTMIHHQL